jgi:PAS domain-containing protein
MKKSVGNKPSSAKKASSTKKKITPETSKKLTNSPLGFPSSDKRKTKDQLIEELSKLRGKTLRLEKKLKQQSPSEHSSDSTGNDFTYKNQLEIKSKESEERFRILFNESPVALWVQDISDMRGAIEEIKNSGVKDFKEYIESNPRAVNEILRKSKILDVNNAALALSKAKS